MIYLATLVLYVNLIKGVQTAAIWMTDRRGGDLRHGHPLERLPRSPLDAARSSEAPRRGVPGAGVEVTAGQVCPELSVASLPVGQFFMGVYTSMQPGPRSDSAR